MENLQVKETEGGEDRISRLPDCLIIDEILSRLSETSEAIRTGTLSKRWQHLWPSVPCLSFYERKPSLGFYLFVDKTLTQCQSSLTNLNKFDVSVTYDNRFKSHVKNWIHFVTSKNVRKLELFLHTDNDDLNEKEYFVMEDDGFFINPHLTDLFFSFYLVKPTGPISWNNLTHLTTHIVKLDNDVIANILSGSPLLDTLELEYSYGYTRVDITSKSVKNLVIKGYEPFDEDVLEINAPYISSLIIKDTLWLRTILLRDVSSLVKAVLDYCLKGEQVTFHERKMLKNLYLNLLHVKELIIESNCYEALAYLEAKGILQPSHQKGLDGTLYFEYLSKAVVDCCDNDSSDGDSSNTNTSDSDSVDTNASDSDAVESGDSEDDEVN